MSNKRGRVKKKGRVSPAPKIVEMGFALEVDPQTEFDLAWRVELSRDVPKRRRAVERVARIGELELVQHIGELGEERHSNPLRELELLSDSQVQVPGWESSKPARAATVVVQAKDQTPEPIVYGGGISKHVDTKAAIRRVGVRPDCARDDRSLMSDVAASVWHQESCLLVRAALVAVHLTEGLA